MAFIQVTLEDGSEEYRHVDYDKIIAEAEERDAATVPLNILSQEEIDARNATQYQRDRAVAYPSIQDQLDTLYHGGYDAWKASIADIKDQFPKPTN